MAPSLEVGLLAELRAALAEHEVTSELLENLACLAVNRPDSCYRVWVFIGFRGRYFSWNNAQHQHPVRDIAGAARRIASQIQDSSGKKKA